MAKTTVLPEDKIASLPIIFKDGRKVASEKEEKYLREVCEFEFYNLEETGLAQKFPYGSTKNKHTFVFFHGGRYRLPRFIAQWVEDCATPIWKWRPDGTGRIIKQIEGQKPRFQMRHIFS